MKTRIVVITFLIATVWGERGPSWLTKEERAMASSIKMTHVRPEGHKPTCGTADPGIMQLMMLPATSMRDIFMHNVMSPLMNLLVGQRSAQSTSRQEDNEVERKDKDSSVWSIFKDPGQQISTRKQRKNWWRKLGQIQKSKDDKKANPKVFTVPTDPSHIAKSRKKRTIGLYSYAPWLTNDIPYSLSPNLNSNDRLTIAKAMDQIEQGTCVRFVPRGFNPYYVHIARECTCGSRSCAFNGAYANVGPGPLPGLPSRLRILTCLSPNDADAVGIVTHELLHNMGLLHTHTRADRDEYVRVNYLNVLPDKWIDYAWNPLQFPLGTDYDCDSIMHYRDTSFNIGSSKTLEAVDPGRCRLRSRSPTPTRADRRLINTLYNC